MYAHVYMHICISYVHIYINYTYETCIIKCTYKYIYFRGIILLMISIATNLYKEMIIRRVKMSLGRERKRGH